MVGNRTHDLPKLHYVKEHKLYARNDGVVDVVALALAKSAPITAVHGVPRQLVCTGWVVVVLVVG